MVIVCNNFTPDLRLPNEESANLEPKAIGNNKKKTTILHQNEDTQMIIDLGLQALINEVVPQPLNNHVALSWCHRLFIDAKN